MSDESWYDAKNREEDALRAAFWRAKDNEPEIERVQSLIAGTEDPALRYLLGLRLTALENGDV